MIIFFSVTLGLVVGSFLNVVITRLPVMLQREWRQECEAFLAKKAIVANPKPKFNLAVPRSQCPHCHTSIRVLDNIPILSYLLLGGHCRHCKTAIAWRYPLVELLTAIITTFMLMYFHISWTAVFALGFSWSLIALFFIDMDTQLLPDDITLPLLWIGLIANMLGLFTDLSSAVLGALFGYLSFWVISWIYGLLTQRVGMGNGDFKLLATIGAWVGWQLLPGIVFIASVLGLVIGGLKLYIQKQGRHTPIAFGPYLIVTAIVALIWGKAWLLLV